MQNRLPQGCKRHCSSLERKLKHKRQPQKNLMPKRPLQAKLLKLQWFKRPCSSLNKDVKHKKIRWWGNLPLHKNCRRIHRREVWRRRQFRAPMPLEKQQLMAAPCVRADCCHRCCFCWDCGGLRLCEE
ncbi:exo-alpha-sialidase/regulator of sigma E protease [Trypanosoma cruzi]|nr:exo-alpha-sialidase/regulator of sigma E protease [Trypanosoma cruzi]